MAEEYFSADRLLELHIGANVQVMLENTDVQYHTSFIGVDKGHSIITSLASIQSASDTFDFESTFKKGRVFEMRTIHEGYVFAFETHYTGDWEGELLMTSFPEMVETRRLRAATRYPCALSCDMSIDGQDVYGAITNISHGGCQVKLKKEASFERVESSMNKIIKLDVYFSVLASPTVYEAKIKSAQCDRDGVCIIGLAFIYNYDSVRRYLESLHLDSISPFFK